MEATKKELKLRVLTSSSDKAIVSVYKSGNLVFSSDAVKKFGITSEKHICIATGDNNDFYIGIRDKKDENSIPVHYASKHFYANTKKLFQTEGLPFLQGSISFKLGDELNISSENWIQMIRVDNVVPQNTKTKSK